MINKHLLSKVCTCTYVYIYSSFHLSIHCSQSIHPSVIVPTPFIYIFIFLIRFIHLSICLFVLSCVALTGELKIQNALNYEQDPQNYTLTIEVLDLGEPQQSSSATISICLLDTNDNGPTFTDVPSEPIQIEEHSEYGSVVHFFTIIDKDSHPFNSSTVNIINGDENGLFYFNDVTKALHVNNSVLLDFENNDPIITLTLLATDTYDKSLNDTVSVS